MKMALALILNCFIPGTGTLLLGYWFQGAIQIVLTLLSLVLVVTVWLTFFGLVLFLLVWLYALVLCIFYLFRGISASN